MKSTFQRIAVAGVLCLGLAASAAVAQDRPARPGAGAEDGAAGPRGAERQKLFEDRQHRREQRLHDLLQIKPDQEPAFRTFVSSLEQLRPQRGPGREGRRGAEGERMPLTAPERLDRAVQRMGERQERLEKAAGVVKTFYAALTPDQRKVFDEFGMRAGRGDGHWMRSRFAGPAPAPIR